MTAQRVSISDVATHAGVSVTTVSHTISGNRPVSAATEQRVRASMSELGYESSHAAKALRLGTSQAIGILVPDITNHFFAELASGVEDAAHSAGFSVVLGNTGFDPEREATYLKMIQSRAIDGLVYAAGSPVARSMIEGVASSFPVALADEEIDAAPAILVTSDHEGGGRLVGEHLTQLGHESVLVITGPKGLRSSDDRLAGFRQEFGGVITVVGGDFKTQSGYDTIVEHPPRGTSQYTAVFALNDLMALGAIRALRDIGLDIPGDVSVCGFDDIPTAELMHPTLTTVTQQARRIGHDAAERLLAQLTGRTDDAAATVLSVVLADRESTAPPRSRAHERNEPL